MDLDSVDSLTLGIGWEPVWILTVRFRKLLQLLAQWTLSLSHHCCTLRQITDNHEVLLCWCNYWLTFPANLLTLSPEIWYISLSSNQESSNLQMLSGHISKQTCRHTVLQGNAPWVVDVALKICRWAVVTLVWQVKTECSLCDNRNTVGLCTSNPWSSDVLSIGTICTSFWIKASANWIQCQM